MNGEQNTEISKLFISSTCDPMGLFQKAYYVLEACERSYAHKIGAKKTNTDVINSSLRSSREFRPELNCTSSTLGKSCHSLL